MQSIKKEKLCMKKKRILTGDRPTRKITYRTLFWIIKKESRITRKWRI